MQVADSEVYGAPALNKLEWDAATTCNLHNGADKVRSCVQVQVVLLLYPAPTCTNAGA